MSELLPIAPPSTPTGAAATEAQVATADEPEEVVT
jgi:hypothetical protein